MGVGALAGKTVLVSLAYFASLRLFWALWIVGAWVSERIWPQPTAAMVEMTLTIAAGVLAAVAMGLRPQPVRAEHRQLT